MLRTYTLRESSEIGGVSAGGWKGSSGCTRKWVLLALLVIFYYYYYYYYYYYDDYYYYYYYYY